MEKCNQCPWKNNIRMCMQVHCEVHQEGPICHFINEIKELEREADYLAWRLDEVRK